MTILVKKSGFLNIKDLAGNTNYRKGAGKPGVYLWGFSLENGPYENPTCEANFFPYYVGKHKECMYSRAFDHICSLKGGCYSIFDILKANSNGVSVGAEIKKYQKAVRKSSYTGPPPLSNPNYPQLLYFPEGAHVSYDFINSASIQGQVQWMVEHFCIMFLECNSNEKSNLAELEKYVGNLFGYNKLITKSYSKPNLRVRIDGPVLNNLSEVSDLFR